MQDEKAIALLKEATFKSTEGKINWEETPSQGRYVAALEGKFSLVVGYQIDGDTGEWDPWLALNDINGKRVITIDSSTPGVGKEDLWRIHELARRRALKVDEKLDSVLDTLKKL